MTDGRPKRTPLADLNLPAFTMRHMEYHRIRTAEALAKWSAEELLEWPGFGMTSLRCVREALESLGLHLRDDPPPSRH